VSDVRIILDTSALLAYAQLKDLNVGELIAMVEEEADTSLVGVPAVCFLSAHAQLDVHERARLVDLATRPGTVAVLLPLLGPDTVEVAGMDSRLPGHGMAHALVEVRRFSAILATYEGRAARGHVDDGSVLDL